MLERGSNVYGRTNSHEDAKLPYEIIKHPVTVTSIKHRNSVNMVEDIADNEYNLLSMVDLFTQS